MGGGTWQGTTSQVPDVAAMIVYHGSSQLIEGVDYSVVSNTGSGLVLSTTQTILFGKSVSVQYEVNTSTVIIPAIGVDNKTTVIEAFACNGSGTIDFGYGQGEGQDGAGMNCIVPDEMNYVRGFDFRTVGGTPQVEFYQDGNKLNKSVTSIAEVYTHKETISLSKEGDIYQASPSFEMLKEAGAKSYGVAIPYTLELDEGRKVFHFDSYYPEVTILYTMNAMKHTVQLPNIPGAVVVMSVLNLETSNRCDNELTGIDPTDPRTLPCVLPAEFVLDLQGLLDCDVHTAANETIINETLGPFTADAFGEITLIVPAGTPDGDYPFNTEHIVPRTTITFTLQICDGGCTE